MECWDSSQLLERAGLAANWFVKRMHGFLAQDRLKAPMNRSTPNAGFLLETQLVRLTGRLDTNCIFGQPLALVGGTHVGLQLSKKYLSSRYFVLFVALHRVGFSH